MTAEPPFAPGVPMPITDVPPASAFVRPVANGPVSDNITPAWRSPAIPVPGAAVPELDEPVPDVPALREPVGVDPVPDAPSPDWATFGPPDVPLPVDSDADPPDGPGCPPPVFPGV